MEKATVPGTTFKKHSLIVRGLLSENDEILSDILFSPLSLTQMEKVIQRLEFLKHNIRHKDCKEARRFFDRLRDNVGMGRMSGRVKKMD